MSGKRKRSRIISVKITDLVTKWVIFIIISVSNKCFLYVHKLLLSQSNNCWSDANFVLGLFYRVDVGHFAEVSEALVSSIFGFAHVHIV
jgi:hypothetical protein